MRAVVQRVSRAGVSVAGKEVSAIGRGMLVLACVEKGDDEAAVRWVAEKIRSLRIFDDGQGSASSVESTLKDTVGDDFPELMLVWKQQKGSGQGAQSARLFYTFDGAAYALVKTTQIE